MSAGIDADVLSKLPLPGIDRVTFYKRDEITADLICCDVEIAGKTWTFHEELKGWQTLVQHLEGLPGFQADWFAAVSQPPFSTSETIAFPQT